MALITNSAEGGTNTTVCTPGVGGNTGGGSGRYFDGIVANGSSSFSFTNEQASHGTLSYKVNTNGTDVQYLEWISAATAASFAARGYVYLPSLPTAGNGFINLRTGGGGTSLATILVTNGNLQIQNAGGTQVWNSGAVTPPTGQWLRWEIKGTNGNAATGTLDMDWYVGDSLTPISGLSAALTGQNFGTANFGRIRVARTAAFGTWASFYIDDPAFNDGATTYIGPKVNQAPTVSVTPDQNVTAAAVVNVSATAGDVDGSIAGYLWTFDYPTSGAPSLTGSTTSSVTFTAGSAPALYVLRCTVTDDQGSTAFATTEVRVPVSGSTTLRPLPMNGTGTGTWTIGGGSSTAGAALSDESDSTYVESPGVTGTEVNQRWRLQPSNSKASGQFEVRLWADTGTANTTIRLIDNATVRQTWTQAVTTTPTAYTFVFNSTTISAISDWGKLYLEVGATT